MIKRRKMKMEQYGCVLLKGGKSNRMGGSDKAKLLYRGKSFEERIKGELEQLGLPVFVSEAKKSPDPRAIPDLISPLLKPDLLCN
jgi:molybdopterin-guanine dinucleotide biosynthesis protein A